ncbi:MAG: ribonuclease H family protein [Dysgonamonadaceae bacterium]|jgi:ribonuclease HI|nr:ribonuclease H family protein [Dysgonamonadaceae bacterium]
MKQKYYVVWKGLETGVFDSWEKCRQQVEGFEGALYKSFASAEAAREAYHNHPDEYLIGKKQPRRTVPQSAGFLPDSWAVDAACSGNPGAMEYRGVSLREGKELFRSKLYPKGTNNIGEFLAIVHGLAMLQQQKRTIPVYSDSVNAISWVKNKHCKTRLERCAATEALFQVIERAEQWLQTHEYPNPVLKWETELWGEIPADFGRK